MARTIKLTQRQIDESENALKLLYFSDTPVYNGNSEITVTGKLNGNDDGDAHTTDDFASMNCPQPYNRYGSYGYMRYGEGRVEEGVDNDNDGVDDFYNNKEIDILGNGDKSDNLTKIPYGIEKKLDALLNACQQLTAKQKAIVLNKILEDWDLSSLSYNIKKLLLKKINVKKK